MPHLPKENILSTLKFLKENHRALGEDWLGDNDDLGNLENRNPKYTWKATELEGSGLAFSNLETVLKVGVIQLRSIKKFGGFFFIES